MDVARLQRLAIAAARRVRASVSPGAPKHFATALADALREDGLQAQADVPFRETYGGVEVIHRAELIIEDTLVVDFATDANRTIAYLANILQLTGMRHGLLLNFAEDVTALAVMDDGHHALIIHPSA